jgi:hypothetical protein
VPGSRPFLTGSGFTLPNGTAIVRSVTQFRLCLPEPLVGLSSAALR